MLEFIIIYQIMEKPHTFYYMYTGVLYLGMKNKLSFETKLCILNKSALSFVMQKLHYIYCCIP